MTGRRSRSARSAALAVLLAFGCSTGAMLGCSTAPRTTRHFLEDPPPSPDLLAGVYAPSEVDALSGGEAR